MSGRIARSPIPVRAQHTLSSEALTAIIQAKNAIRSGQFGGLFGNQYGNFPGEGPPLPAPALGSTYFEWDVGQARPGDSRGQRGSKRLVLEISEKSGQILEMYYTDEHYGKFTFVRIV